MMPPEDLNLEISEIDSVSFHETTEVDEVNVMTIPSAVESMQSNTDVPAVEEKSWFNFLSF
jgi:hypothetical protein